jgi:hypothetical protein
MLIGFTNIMEIGVIRIPLHSIAAIAKSLEVAEFIRTTMISREEVINLKSFFLSRNTTKLAMEFGSLQNLITN